MRRIGSIALFLAIFLNAPPLWPQQQTPRSKIVSDLSARAISAMGELRDRAHHKLFAANAPYAAPDIATSLADPLSFIAFAVVTPVKLPSGGGSPSTLLPLLVDHLLRGISHQNELLSHPPRVPPRPPD